jgi:hypothetical protein
VEVERAMMAFLGLGRQTNPVVQQSNTQYFSDENGELYLT